MADLNNKIKNKLGKQLLWFWQKLKAICIYLYGWRRLNFNRSWKEIVGGLVLMPIIFYAGLQYHKYLNKSCSYVVIRAMGDRKNYNTDTVEKWLQIGEICRASIAEEFDSKELYYYYKVLRYVDEKILPEEKDYVLSKADYYSYLFFANLYGDNKYADELKQLEKSMTIEGFKKAFYVEGKDYKNNKTSAEELYGYFKMKDHLNKNVFKSQSHMSYLAEHHKYLYYANVHSGGRYQQELDEYEANMTREEKLEAFGVLGVILTNPDFLPYIKQLDYDKAFEYVSISAELGDMGSQLILGGGMQQVSL